MFTAVPAHACMAILMGYYVGMAKFSNNPSVFLCSGFMIAFMFHGTYDFFLSIESYPIMASGALLALFFSIKASMKAMKIHQENSPFRIR
jgi:RsiW-degrading membrane proteinase PrsW (M82 family)